MKTQKVLETVYIPDWDTTALILEDDIRVNLFIIGKTFNRQECFAHIDQYMPGWVQTTNNYKEAMAKGIATGAKDCLGPYENLYDDLKKYAKDKFGDQFKPHEI